ncbi:hypothetical protein Emag_001969 [Eimeria magna]
MAPAVSATRGTFKACEMKPSDTATVLSGYDMRHCAVSWRMLKTTGAPAFVAEKPESFPLKTTTEKMRTGSFPTKKPAFVLAEAPYRRQLAALLHPHLTAHALRPVQSDQPGRPADADDLRASVLEPLQRSSDSYGTNPFEAPESDDAFPKITHVGEAQTAFASASSSRTGGGRAAHASSMLYPEGLPKFLGLLRPTMTFGIGHSTLSRGMDFIAHFVAITTMVSFLGLLFAVSWMQKLCLPIVRHWDRNYTFGLGAFTVLLANFDLKRSKLFLFLLGWRLHFFLLLSLLMGLGLLLKPQLHAHIESSVRACVLERTRSDFPPQYLNVSMAPEPPSSLPSAVTNDREPLLLDLPSHEAHAMAPSATAVDEAPTSPAVAAPIREDEGGPFEPPHHGESSAANAAETNRPSADLTRPAAPVQPELPSQGPQAGRVNWDEKSSSQAPPIARLIDLSAAAPGGAGAKEHFNSNSSAQEDNVPTPSSTSDTVANESASPAGISSPHEVPHASTASGTLAMRASQEPEEAQLQNSEKELSQNKPETAQPVHQTLDVEGQKRAVEAAQQAAVQDFNAIVVAVLVIASIAVVFEIYLFYACWSFKVWMERGFESVVLAGASPFPTLDAGNGWLAYAVRMPQTVQMETYGQEGESAGPTCSRFFTSMFHLRENTGVGIDFATDSHAGSQRAVDAACIRLLFRLEFVGGALLYVLGDTQPAMPEDTRSLCKQPTPQTAAHTWVCR